MLKRYAWLYSRIWITKRSGFTIIKGNHEEILDHEEKYFDEELTVEFFLKEP